MPATVIVYRETGSGPTLTDVTSTTNRLSLADSASPGTANPLGIPAASSIYSFWAAYYLQCTVAPAGGIDTVKLYSDGSNTYGTGVTLQVAQSASYVQATGSATSGTQLLVANVTGLTPSPPDNFFSFTSGAALSVTGSIAATTGRITNRVYFQMTIASTATPGTLTGEAVTWSYNEF